MELRRLHTFPVLVVSSIYFLLDAKYVSTILFKACTGRQKFTQVEYYISREMTGRDIFFCQV